VHSKTHSKKQSKVHSKTHSKKQSKVHSKTHSKKQSKVHSKTFKLYENDSGVRLFITPKRTETKSTSLYFYIKVGSKNETPEVHGISHFIEHMLFKGTKKYPNYLDISKLFVSNGISFNAYTSKECTAYHYKFLSTKENVDLICDITSEMIYNSLMNTKDITPERNVIIQEYNDGIDDIDDYISDKLEECIFNEHPLGKPIIGTIDSLKSINKIKLVDYYKKYYTPENLVIGLSGNINSDYISIIEKYFKRSSSPFTHMNKYTPSTISIIPFVDTHPSYRIHCFHKSLTQDYINIIFKTKGYYDPNRYYYKLLSNILGGNMSSRLFVEIREKLGLAYSIKTDITNYEETGYFSIYTQNENKDTIKCIDHIFSELIKFKKHGVSETELKNNKKNYCDIYKTNFDDIEYENEFYANQLLFNKPFETLQLRVDKIQDITSEQIKDSANDLFNFHKVHIITFGEIKKDKIENLLKKILKQ
jgi:predicted Zn-dependent peptidase